MLVIWKVRVLKRSDRKFKDLSLVLETSELSAVKKARVELYLNQRTSSFDRGILSFREWFEEREITELPPEIFQGDGKIITVTEYFEDESGEEISFQEMGQVVTGDPNTQIFPSCYRSHDIVLSLSNPEPVPIDEISLSSRELKLLAYFVRDYSALLECAFVKENPGSLHATSLSTSTEIDPSPTLTTATSNDEIHSAVMIFRRLYMEKETADFLKAANVFIKALGSHPIAKWVKSERKEYTKKMTMPVSSMPFDPPVSFTRRQLIDAFLYTQYAHQPKPKMEPIYQDCLAQLQERKSMLMFLFLTELHSCCLQICNAGNQIAKLFSSYCERNGIDVEIVPLAKDCNPMIGSMEKSVDRNFRLHREQVERLANDLWIEDGRPSKGAASFIETAEQHLSGKADTEKN